MTKKLQNNGGMVMAKRILCLLLTMSIILSFAPIISVSAATTASGTCGDNLTWTLDDNGTLTISGTGDMRDWTYSSVPWESNRNSIKSVIIENGVTSIGKCAFADCSNLSNAKISNTVKKIGMRAFDGCSFSNITIPNSVTQLGQYIFAGCSELTDVNIGNGITSWDGVGSMFSGCVNLTNVTIQDGGYIGEYAFDGCEKLTNVIMPDNLRGIGEHAFYDTAIYNDERNWENGVLYIGKHLIASNASIPEIYTIKDGTQCIANEAFRGCTNLMKIIIPKTVTVMGDCAFYYCLNLTNIEIPNGVTSIPWLAFEDCHRLAAIAIPESVTSIDYGAFSSCKSLSDVYYGGSKKDWNNISVHGNNTPLTNATIHYNSVMPDDEPLPTVIPVKPDTLPPTDRSLDIAFMGGGDIVYNADENKYNADSFMLITTLRNLFQDGDWDRTDYSAYNVKAEITLPDGYSFEQSSKVSSKTYTFDEISSMEDITETVYLQNPPVGVNQMTVKITGDNVNEKTFTYNFNVEKYVFEFNKYRANYLINTWRCETMENDLDFDNSPSRQLYNAGKEAGLDGAAGAWNVFMDTLGAIDNPSSILDYAFEEKDMYEAIIMSMFESSVDYKIIDCLNSDITKQTKDLFSNMTSIMKSKYNFDLLDGTDLTRLTEKQRKEVASDMTDYFKNDYPSAATISQGVSFISKAMEYEKDFRVLCEKISSYYNILRLSDSMKQIMQDMYDNCPSDNLALKQALKDCIGVMNSSDDEFSQRMIANLIALTGKNVAQAGLDEFWKEVKSSFSVAHPAAFAFQAAYTAGKYITQVCFNSDQIAEKFFKIEALVNTEKVMQSVYNKEKSDFLNTQSEYNAEIYNSAIDTMFNMYDTDCDYAYAFVDAVDSGIFSKISSALGDKTNEEIKKQIKSIQSSTSVFHESVLTDWITGLYDDFPSKYEYYENIRYENMKKKYNISCPVDVYVFDMDGVIVGSVVDNVPYCRSDANITIATEGDKKTIYMYGDNQYKIVYEGNDTGTMDITVTEYDNNNSSRNVYFNGLELTDGLKYTSTENGTISEDNAYVLTNEAKETIVPDYDTQTDSDGATYTGSITRGYFIEDMGVSRELHVGENAEITAYVPDGYKFIGWTSDAGEDIFDDSSSITTTICMPSYDVNITANIEPLTTPTVTITATASSGGTISPSGDVEVPYGGNQTFTITPKSGYTISNVTVNGVSQGAVDEYTVYNATEDITIEASFKINSTSSSSGSGGSGGGSGFSSNGSTSYPSTTSIITSANAATATTTQNGNPFSDVSASDWYYDNVAYVYNNGIMNGTAANLFSPNDNATRGMIATILYRMTGESYSSLNSGFTDVNLNEYYAIPISWAQSKGIVNGVGSNMFNPDGNVTRQDFAAMLYRLAAYEQKDTAITSNNTAKFSDAGSISDYAVTAMEWCIAKGLIQGNDLGLLAPNDNATRAEIAAIIQRYKTNL